MSDKISRQDAIDYVDDVPYIKMHPNIGLLWKAWLKQLPSAEPEIIHCRDCENLKIDSIYHDCWCDGRKVWLDFYCGNAKRKNGGRA